MTGSILFVANEKIPNLFLFKIFFYITHYQFRIVYLNFGFYKQNNTWNNKTEGNKCVVNSEKGV